MISEGTDIPRLQVCCYLSRIRTELHYRQVLGRVLRRTGESDGQAWLFMLAEPVLRSFAERIAYDLPDDLAVLNEVHIPAFTSVSNSGWIEPAGNTDALESCTKTGSKQATDIGSTATVHLADFVAEPSHQVSFSKHYRQQLLACF